MDLVQQELYNMKNLVQIGTNMAYDDFARIVKGLGNDNINQLNGFFCFILKGKFMFVLFSDVDPD